MSLDPVLGVHHKLMDAAYAIPVACSIRAFHFETTAWMAVTEVRMPGTEVHEQALQQQRSGQGKVARPPIS
jgi:hypothetical protein